MGSEAIHTEKNKKIELCLPLFFVALGIYMIFVGHGLSRNDGYFPMLVGAIMLLSSLSIFIRTWKTQNSVIHIEKINLRNIAVTVLILVGYVIVLNRIGYFISTFLLGVLVIRLLGYKNKVGLILYPLAIVAILFLGFKFLLNVPLPTVFLDV